MRNRIAYKKIPPFSRVVWAEWGDAILMLGGGQGNEKRKIVLLLAVTRVRGGAVAASLTAELAFVRDDVAAPCIRLGIDRAHRPFAGILTVSRHDIDMERPKAKGAMVARGVAERLDLAAAVGTDKARIVF